MTVTAELDREHALRLRLEALATDYVHCIDDDRLEEWPDFFTEDGSYRVTSRENFDLGLPVSLIYCHGRGMMRDRISAMRVANIFEPHTYCHLVSAMKLEETDAGLPSPKRSSGFAQAGGHRTRSNFTVIRTMSDGAMSVFACGRYLDHVVEQAGVLKYRERTVILDSKRIDTLLIIPI
jgi:anthranilate 1,2-dioxygenase small subunit